MISTVGNAPVEKSLVRLLTILLWSSCQGLILGRDVEFAKLLPINLSQNTTLNLTFWLIICIEGGMVNTCAWP